MASLASRPGSFAMSFMVALLVLMASNKSGMVAGRCTDSKNVVYYNTGSFKSGSAYEKNLALVMDRLIQTTGYDNVGSVYGFSECYGSAGCRDCLVAARNAIKGAAPKSIGARTCRDKCYFRYENYRI